MELDTSNYDVAEKYDSSSKDDYTLHTIQTVYTPESEEDFFAVHINCERLERRIRLAEKNKKFFSE